VSVFFPMDPAYTGAERPMCRVVIVNGYGCDINSPLKPYLDEVIDFVVRSRTHIAVFCGAATQCNSFPGRTEARVMSEYVLAHLPPGFGLAVHHEEDSYTTCENAIGAARILRFLQSRLWDGRPPEPGELTVYCEAQRVFKVMLCYWLLLPDYRPKDGDPAPELRVSFRTASWERTNPLSEIPKLFNELLMLKIPAWRRYIRNIRIAKSATR
jgi:hypothetical protein